MKYIIAVLSLILTISCKETTKEIKKEMPMPEKVAEMDMSKYPEALQKVLKAHGGLAAWNNKRVISFEIPKENSNEVHTIDLKNRDEKIEMEAIQMGYDGSEYWLHDEKEMYKGDPVFYHNLMFYFYAMPFVLADDGINYGETEALEYEGKSYPGIQISYNTGVGVSPKDEYFIHYNPETFQMEWLGYTVTYRTGEKSERISWIRYNDWMDVEGVKLPNSLTWFEVEDQKLIKPRSTRNFENVSLSEMAKSKDFYAKPEGAKVVNEVK